MKTLSVVIPALNECENLPALIDSIPVATLRKLGWGTEILIVDNGSTDGTGELAQALGARVVVQPVRGYGNAYKAGFANSTGQVIATGDADLTYPFDALPELLEIFESYELDFLSTDRLHSANRQAMKSSHTFGNHVLSAVSRQLFGAQFRDSQSGMWILRRELWHGITVRSPGMAFSQEIKNEAAIKGYRCREVAIEYRPRGGEVKLNAPKDGLINLVQLVAHRARSSRSRDVRWVPQQRRLPYATGGLDAGSAKVRPARDIEPDMTLV